MRGRPADDGTCLSLWRRRCRLRCRCLSLPGCCLNSEKDLETEERTETGDEKEAVQERR